MRFRRGNCNLNKKLRHEKRETEGRDTEKHTTREREREREREDKRQTTDEDRKHAHTGTEATKAPDALQNALKTLPGRGLPVALIHPSAWRQTHDNATTALDSLSLTPIEKKRARQKIASWDSESICP